MIVFLILSFHFLEELINAFRNFFPGQRKRIMTFYLLIIVVSAFALKPCIQFMKSLKNIITVDQVNPYKKIAKQIDTVEFLTPYAIIRSSQKSHTDYYIAYFLQKQLLGRPVSTDVEAITKELKAANAKSIVVFDNLEIVEKFKRDKRYAHIASKKLKKDSRYLHTVNIKQDNIKGWDEEINIFTLK